MGLQRVDNILAIEFTVAKDTVVVGDVVELTGVETCAKLATVGSLAILGTVVKYKPGDTFCTVDCSRFGSKGWPRKSGAAIAAVGPFVFDAAGTVIAYASGTHSPASIAGLVCTTATAANETVVTLEF